VIARLAAEITTTAGDVMNLQITDERAAVALETLDISWRINGWSLVNGGIANEVKFETVIT
jgi:hypothetical protein